MICLLCALNVGHIIWAISSISYGQYDMLHTVVIRVDIKNEVFRVQTHVFNPVIRIHCSIQISNQRTQSSPRVQTPRSKTFQLHSYRASNLFQRHSVCNWYFSKKTKIEDLHFGAGVAGLQCRSNRVLNSCKTIELKDRLCRSESKSNHSFKVFYVYIGIM